MSNVAHNAHITREGMATHLYLKHLRQLSKHYMDILYNLYNPKGYFTTELDNVQHSCDQSLSHSTAVSAIVIGVLVLMLLNELYEKLVGRILKRMGVMGSSRSRVSGATWNFGFYFSCLLCSLLTAENIGSNLFIAGKMPFPAVVCSVIFSSFCIHSALISAKKACGGQFVSKIFVAAILWSSNALSFVWLGTHCMMLVSLGTSSAEFTKIFAGLKKNKWANTSSLESVVATLFVIHCLIWAACFLYVFPQSVLWPAFTLEVSDRDIVSVLILNVTLWVYILAEIFTSPLFKMLEYYLRPDSRYIHNEMMEYALFPQHNEVLKYLMQIRREVQKQQKVHQHYGHMLRNEVSSGFRRSKDSVALMQTVRCVMLLKRRLRKRHQQQVAEDTV